MKKVFTLLLLCQPFFSSLSAQSELIINTQGRKSVSLDGAWYYIVDPYETGAYDYRLKDKRENDGGAYWNEPSSSKKSDWSEHGFKAPYTLQVPGDWNSQNRIFEYYEGTVWYQRHFNKPSIQDNEALFLHFGAVNYEAHVYLNGKKLGMHKGGFTPFNFSIPKEILKDTGNNLVVKVDNKRHLDEIPTVNTDWWNYGGITRSVHLLIVPDQFITQYHIQLKQDQDITLAKKKKQYQISGWVKLNEPGTNKPVTVEIPALKIRREFIPKGDSVFIDINTKQLELWSTRQPKLYEVNLLFNNDKITDHIGFRKIEVAGDKILLNGEQVLLRAISIHEEVGPEVRRAHSQKDALKLLGWAKELNCNMVRLAHYPHNEFMHRMADSLGLMVWDEIPVYWTINFSNPQVLDKAKAQLKEMITRDRNRASVVIWSVGNETPVSEKRTEFMKTLVLEAKKLDDTRLVSAALEVRYNAGLNFVDDPLGEYTDIVSLNEYLGWYAYTPDACRTAKWDTKYKNKPFFISETGAEAKFGFRDVKEARFSEDYQKWFYEEQINMFKNSFPSNYSGVCPWLLVDFKSPKRNNPVYQNGFNRKGLIDEYGNKKLAFFVLRDYYNELEKKELDLNKRP